MFPRHKKNKKIGVSILAALVLALTFALSVTPVAQAGEFIESETKAVVAENEVIHDDLFIGGQDVLVAGKVEGDLFAFGENVVISGEVDGNVFTAGNTVAVSGVIDGALMIAGYDLTLEESASIGRNIYFGGFSFQAMPESLVNRSIYGGGYQMLLDGSVGRDVTAGLGAMKVAGPVGGDINVEIGEPSNSDNVNPTDWFPGMPAVKVLDPGYEVNEERVDGEVNIKLTPVDTDIDTDIQVDPGYFLAQRLRRRTGEFIALMLVGMLALWLMRGTLLKAVEEVKKNVAIDSVWGILIYLLYIPVVFILFLLLLMLTIAVSLITLGSFAGEMISISSFTFFGGLTLFGLLAGVATKILIGYLVGRLILEKTSKPSFENYWTHVGALAIGVFLYELLRAIPFIGWLFMVVVVVIGTGAFAVMISNAIRKKPVTTTSDSAEVTPV